MTPPLTFPLRVTDAMPMAGLPRSDLWDAAGMFLWNLPTAWAEQIRDACGPPSATDRAVAAALKFLQELRHPTPPTPCPGGIIIEDCGGPCVRCGVTDKSACPFTANQEPPK